MANPPWPEMKFQIMSFGGDSKFPTIFPPFKQPPLVNLHQAFTNLQAHCSSLFNNLSPRLPQFNPSIDLPSALSSIQTQVKSAFCSQLSGSAPPVWARIAESSKTQFNLTRKTGTAMTTEAIEERLAGVPVYALSNSDEEFVLVSGVSTKKSVGFLCFKREDAEALLEQMKSMDPGMRREGSKVVAVALNKVFQLKVDGVAFRLIPESIQVKNALKEREKAGLPDDSFPGVPVFQSRSLVLRSQNKSYRPVFFRKEDLEKSLLRASREHNQLNPLLRQGDIQVAVFEDIVKGMKDNSSSLWDDIVFIPPGFDVSTDPSQQ